MSSFTINKGFDINLTGKPSLELEDCPDSENIILYPLEFKGLKQRLKVQEGDVVKRGSVIIEDKRDDRFKICSPAGGTIKSIVRGARRFVEQVVIATDADEQVEKFTSYSPSQLSSTSRDEILQQLLASGYLTFLRQRPFSVMADANVKPKSIFVNAMNTAPYQSDASVVASDDPEALQAGIDIMTRLTDGNVNLCIANDACQSLKSISNASIHTFTGPHPAGNTSIHIDRVDPMKLTDTIWFIRAVDLALIGRLFIDGSLPKYRIVSLGGSGVKQGACKHYRMRIGGDLKGMLSNKLMDGENRVINGDILSGTTIEADSALRLKQSSINVLPEGRERLFLGWMEPGFNRYTFSRTCASTFFGRKRQWSLNTNMNGAKRFPILTGFYDKVMPLNIMVDYLLKAVMAGDTEEAIRLGILETDPEDFALCEFIDPSKIEFQEIIRSGLDLIEEEGI